jgi:hypothetical protein
LSGGSSSSNSLLFHPAAHLATFFFLLLLLLLLLCPAARAGPVLLSLLYVAPLQQLRIQLESKLQLNFL